MPDLEDSIVCTLLLCVARKENVWLICNIVPVAFVLVLQRRGLSFALLFFLPFPETWSPILDWVWLVSQNMIRWALSNLFYSTEGQLALDETGAYTMQLAAHFSKVMKR